ncbi:MAG: class I SAM-dependent methyltransferase [Candidatus Tectimicrobiota bacterium]
MAMPSVTDYQRQRYRSLDQALVHWREQRLLTALLSACQLQGGSLLDVPCGYGRFTALFARLGIQATGADAWYDMVQLARREQAPPAHRRWLQADLAHLPCVDNAFDCVVSLRLFHHHFTQDERRRMVRELGRVARRYVIFSFYHQTSLHAMARHWRGTQGRLNMLSTSQVQALIQASGLQLWRHAALCPLLHAQTFVVLRKPEAAPDKRISSLVSRALPLYDGLPEPVV